jgi:hypothetical protein
VRFHGKLLRPESLLAAPRLQADDPDPCWTVTVSHSLPVGFIDHPDYPALAGHDPHRVLEMASVSLAPNTFLVTSRLTQLSDPPFLQPTLPVCLPRRRPIHRLPCVPGSDLVDPLGRDGAVDGLPTEVLSANHWRSGREVGRRRVGLGNGGCLLEESYEGDMIELIVGSGYTRVDMFPFFDLSVREARNSSW